MPTLIHSNGATYFRNTDFRMFCDRYSIRKEHHALTMPIKLFDRALINPLLFATVNSETVDWDDVIPRIDVFESHDTNYY